MNDPTADTLVCAKPLPEDVNTAIRAKREGRRVLVDYCDDHFERAEYGVLLHLADAVICASAVLADRVRALRPDIGVTVIAEPYEFPERLPHAQRAGVLWFGHAVNAAGYRRAVELLYPYPVTAVSNLPGTIPWSLEMLASAFAQCGIVVLPQMAPHKTANRAVEAIRQGCAVVAEPHPSLKGFPGLYIGGLSEGVAWVMAHPEMANHRTRLAQQYVRDRFSPTTIAAQWAAVLSAVAVLA